MSYNPRINGSRHTSTIYGGEEHKRCADQFQNNETFRELFREALPPLRVLERLYNVGIEVNRFQKEELRQCVIDNKR